MVLVFVAVVVVVAVAVGLGHGFPSRNTTRLSVAARAVFG